jgi:integral membrane sensor domain MASE1
VFIVSTLTKTYAPRIQKRFLLLIAGIVWCFAGGMISYIGISAYAESQPILWYGPALSAVVFGLFFFLVFLKMFRRHRIRILGYEKERICVFAFFDVKSWIIMACMITFGILLRSSGLLGTFWLGRCTLA